MKFFILVLIVPSMALADNTAVPWILPEQTTCEQDVQDYKDLTDTLKQKIDLKDKEINILDQRLVNYQQLSTSLADQVGKQQTTEGLYRFGYFALGVLVTGLIVHNVRP